MLAAQAEMRLDPLLPRVQIFLHLAAKNLAKLGVDAADVRGHRGHYRKYGDEEDLERRHGFRLRAGLLTRRLAVAPSIRVFCEWVGDAVRSISPSGSPSRARNLRSRRCISPSSVS